MEGIAAKDFQLRLVQLRSFVEDDCGRAEAAHERWRSIVSGVSSALVQWQQRGLACAACSEELLLVDDKLSSYCPHCGENTERATDGE